MFDDRRSFLTRPFLLSHYAIEYAAYEDGEDEALVGRLERWSSTLSGKETADEGAFVQTFFAELWGYTAPGRDELISMSPQHAVPDAGAGGGKGQADLALGWFKTDGKRLTGTPQVLCEFKGDGAPLDTPQKRRDKRTPIKQCFDYLRGARRDLFGTEPVQPRWGLVTNMNEFRLYWWDRGPDEYLRFVVRNPEGELPLDAPYDLLARTDEARFDRFLLTRLFARGTLIAEAGRPTLLRLIERQWATDKAIEEAFYGHYREVRERLFAALLTSNPRYQDRKVDLLRLSQRLLDRFIFAFYLEDMGEQMLFPPQYLRNQMRDESVRDDYEENGESIWSRFKRLFAEMVTGGTIGRLPIPHINGGLFAPDPEIEALRVPNEVFAAPGDGARREPDTWDKRTLLYLSGRYNYAARGEARESLTLYTLGRIFEQSITELEYREGELEDRESVASLSKRKRDGVYYTPERIVTYMVRETLGPWLAAARERAELDEAAPTPAAVERYEAELRALSVVDPACGSGAFLIAAFRYLLDEREKTERLKVAARNETPSPPDLAALTADILSRNLYGVDVNPASVEIAKLALWLHSARAKAPLSELDGKVRHLNSLLGPDFAAAHADDPALLERHGVRMSWAEAFPDVFAPGPDGSPGGFDVVLGNPPYVKVQKLREIDRAVPDWLQDGERNSSDPLQDGFVSAQTGSFDLYLPFIELGLRLMRPGGRMAYIAPNLWPINKSGRGLRTLVRERRALDRWLDFKSYQVFDDVTTYTACQFFAAEPQDAQRIALAPGGGTEAAAWASGEAAVPYGAVDPADEWLMATGAERRVIERLARDCLRLDDAKLTKAIFVGIQTSADDVYHLRKVGAGQYECHPRGKDAPPPYVVELEDAVMRRLVSGDNASRYEVSVPSEYLLFPYEKDGAGANHLIAEAKMDRTLSQAWRHLNSYKNKLLKRAGTKPDTWWGYSFPKNLDLQEFPKLIVAQTVPNLRVSADADGSRYLNNVRVNGIIPTRPADLYYILGVLNGRVSDFVFTRIAKCKRGGYYESNKQFIAPLPVPDASREDRHGVAWLAWLLEQGWTRRRDLLAEAERRLGTLAKADHPAEWLWPDLATIEALTEAAPATLRDSASRQGWAATKHAEALAARQDALAASLTAEGARGAAFVPSPAGSGGELRLSVDGQAVLDGVFVDAEAGEAAAAWWRWLLLTRNVSDGAGLSAAMRRPPVSANAALRDAAAIIGALEELTSELARAEAAMEAELTRLYALSEAEAALIGG